MIKIDKIGLIKKMLVSALCICVVVATAAVYADNEGLEGTDVSPEVITLYGKDAMTSDETQRSVSVDTKSGENIEYAALSILQNNIKEDSAVAAEFEFYAKTSGVYNLTGIMSKYVTVDNWVSPYSISINDGELVAADKLSGFSQTDGGYGSSLMDINFGTVYLNVGINKLKIVSDKASQYGKTILVHLSSVTFTKNDEPGDDVIIDYTAYALTHIDNLARPSDFNISPNADTGSILIQTSTMDNYKGFVLNYTFTAPKDGFYKLSGFINGYKSAYVSPFSISYDDNEPEKISDLIAAGRATAAGTITSMAAAEYNLGNVYLNGGVHTLKITIDTSINGGLGNGYKLQFGKTNQNFVLEYISDSQSVEKIALEGNDCVYDSSALKNTAKDSPAGIDGDVYLYYGTTADNGQTYTFDFYPVAQNSGYYSMIYTGTCNSNYYCDPTIKVGKSNAVPIAELKSLAKDNGTQNFDVGSVWLDAGVNKVTISFKGHTKATAGTANPAYNIRIGKMSFSKISDDIFITAESPMYYTGSAKQNAFGGNSSLERLTYIQVDPTDSNNAPIYKFYAPKSGEYDFTVSANGLLKDITFDSDITVGSISSSNHNDYVGEYKMDAVELSKGAHTIKVNMKEPTDTSMRFNLDCIKASARTDNYTIKAVNAQRYIRQKSDSYGYSRNIVLNAVNTDSAEKAVNVLIAEYDSNTGALNGIYTKNENLVFGNNFLNFDLADILSGDMLKNEIKVIVFDNVQNIRPVMQKVSFPKNESSL